jgi:chaperone required for assembly of F1-ATPase
MTPIPHPKRFYTKVETQNHAEGFAVTLDGRIPKSPAKNPLILPSLESAQLVAKEWENQSDHIIPTSMPLTRLVNVVLDRGDITRDAMIEEIIKYAKTDLVCYRAPTPKSLVEAQAAAWDPLMDWSRNNYQIALDITYEALAVPQPEASLQALRAHLETRDVWRLTALAFANGLAGSAIVALALIDGHIDGETAFKAIRVEEDWQAARWGTDPDEALIANARRMDLVAVGELMGALN